MSKTQAQKHAEIVIALDAENKQLKAELAAIKRPMESAGFKAEGMIAVGQELINRDLRITELEAELAALKEFARHVIQIECWSLYEQDGGDLQDLAEKLGLIEQHTATVADVDEESDFEVGDIIYKFTDILKGAKT